MAGRHVRTGADRWWPLACAAAAVVATGVGATAAPADETPSATASSAAGQPTAGNPLPYWQAPPLPTAVIQGGAIPPGWQPQAMPYQGIGPDGRPLTMYFAPTYVFTYQAGPPVLAVPPAGRTAGVARTPPASVATSGWNYATSGAEPATMTLTPGSVSRYRAAYRLPPDSRALAGTPLVPPGPLPAQPVPAIDAWASAPVAQPVPQPPPQYAVAPPPTQWVASSPQQPIEPLMAAGATGATAAGMMGQPPPAPVAALTPPPAAPPANVPVLEPLPPQPAVDGSFPPPPRPVAARTWRVVGVYDGDSLTCLDESSQQQKVRLAGIDAPEGGQPYAKESRDALAALVFGRTVDVVDVGRDPAGRVIARVTINGTDVSRDLVATGNAWVAPTTADASLSAAQSAAQAARLGLWSQATPIAPWDYRSGG